MEQWYALSAVSGREKEAAELIERKISHEFWKEFRIPKKVKVFRSGGFLHLVEDVMFSGYILVNTNCPEELVRVLGKVRDFPQPLLHNIKGRNVGQKEMIPLEPEGVKFLKSVCGENLQKPMGITLISLSKDKHIVRAEGILAGYLNQIVTLNLHKRFAVVEVDLFNRKQAVLFGVRLEQDLTG